MSSLNPPFFPAHFPLVSGFELLNNAIFIFLELSPSIFLDSSNSRFIIIEGDKLFLRSERIRHISAGLSNPSIYTIVDAEIVDPIMLLAFFGLLHPSCQSFLDILVLLFGWSVCRFVRQLSTLSLPLPLQPALVLPPFPPFSPINPFRRVSVVFAVPNCGNSSPSVYRYGRLRNRS